MKGGGENSVQIIGFFSTLYTLFVYWINFVQRCGGGFKLVLEPIVKIKGVVGYMIKHCR